MVRSIASIQITVSNTDPQETKSQMTTLLENLQVEIAQMFPNCHLETEILQETPTITISLSGPSGNAFSIMAGIKVLLKQFNMGYLINDYLNEATSSDYENLKEVSEKYAAKVGYDLIWIS